jgi:AcrR family transcriptional regulator
MQFLRIIGRNKMNLKEKKKLQVEHLMREEICAAVCRIMSETSFQDMKMSAIAKEAGVSKGTLYNYFESKEELFSILIDDMESECEVLSLAVLNDTTLASKEKLIQYIKEIFGFAQANITWIILFFNYANEFSTLDEKRKKSFDKMRSRILYLFNDGIESGEWVVEKPETRAWLLTLIIMESVYELVLNPDNCPSVSDIIDVVLDGIDLSYKKTKI